MSVQELDAASNGSIDRIRSFVDDSDFNSLDGAANIIILDEAHRISAGAQDVLLKSIEDRRLFIIACTTEASKIRPALRDRLDEFAVKPPPSDLLLNRCMNICNDKNVKFNPDALKTLIDFHHSHPRSVLNSLALLIDLGEVDHSGLEHVTNASVRKLVRDVLVSVASESGSKYSLFDRLRVSESASVAREYIVNALNQAIRRYRSVKCEVDTPNFIDTKNYNRFYSVGIELCKCSVITWSDIEFILFNEPQAVYAPSIPSRPASEIPTKIDAVESNTSSKAALAPVQEATKIDIRPETVALPKPLPKPKTIDIEGVKFNSDERITALHDKITPSRGPTVISEESTPVVQYDRHKMPMSEQEFARAFLDRFK
jgi:hypothetical protein